MDARLEPLKKEVRFRNVAAWIGAPQARFLLNYAGRNGNSSDSSMMRQWLDSESGIYDFGGLKLPFPVSEAGTAKNLRLVTHFFEDIIVYFLLDSFDPMFIFRIFDDCEGPYELNDQFRIHRNDIVFDCGANRGVFSAFAAIRGALVYAFEPSRHIRETYLEKTAALNGDFVICPYALSDSPGNLEFIVCHDNFGGSHINQPGEKKGANDDIEIIEALRLDDFVKERGIERVDFIKADIEGAERKMLAGATDIMKNFSPRLSICTYHLPDDPAVLADIILSAQPKYKIVHGPKKMYAYIE